MKPLIIAVLWLYLMGTPAQAQSALDPVEVARYGRGMLGDTRAWSPDGATLAVTGSRGVWFYDTDQPDQPADFLALKSPVMIAYSPDGRLLVGPADGVVSILDADRQPIQTFTAQSAAWSPDGALLALKIEGDLVVLDSQTWEERHRSSASDRPNLAPSHTSNKLVFSPDGRLVLFKYDSGDEWWDDLAVWDIETGVAASIGDYFDNPDFTKMEALVASPDGVTLALLKGGGNTFEGNIRFLNIQTGEVILREVDSPTRTAAFSADGQTFAVVQNPYQVSVWDVATWEQLHLINDEGQPAFSPDGTRLALNGGIYSIETGGLLWLDDEVKERFIVSPAGNALLRWGEDLRLIDPVTGELMAALEGVEAPLAAAEFSSDGRWLLTAHDDLTVYQWEVSTGRLQGDIITIEAEVRGPAQRQPWEPPTFPVYWRFAFSPDGSVVVINNSGEDPSDRQIVWSLDNQRRYPVSQRYRIRPYEPYSAQGDLILEASDNNTVWLLHPPTGELSLLTRLGEDDHFLGLNADSTLLAYHNFDDDRMTIITTDAENPTTLVHIPISEEAIGVGWARFSPDGRFFFFSVTISEMLPSEDYVWDMTLGALIDPEDVPPTGLVFQTRSDCLGAVIDSSGLKWLVYPLDAVEGDAPLAEIDTRGGSAAFTPDCAHLIISYNDGVVMVWQL